MEMNFDRKNASRYAIISAVVFVTVFSWAFFLNATGNIVDDFLNFSISGLFHKLVSLNFVLFLLLFPLTYAIITALSIKLEKVEVMVFSLLGVVVGIGISVLVFPQFSKYGILLLFYIISIPLAIETACMKYAELKNWKMLRTFNQAIERGVLIAGIGVFIFGVITIAPINDKYVKNFEDKFITGTVERMSGEDLGDNLAESSAQVYVSGQQSALSSISSTEQYQNSTDAELKAVISSVEEQVNSREYADTVETTFKKEYQQNVGQIKGKIDILGIVKKQFPFMVTIEKFAWLIDSVIFASFFLFLGSVIFRPLGVLYGLIIGKIIIKQ